MRPWFLLLALPAFVACRTHDPSPGVAASPIGPSPGLRIPLRGAAAAVPDPPPSATAPPIGPSPDLPVASAPPAVLDPPPPPPGPAIVERVAVPGDTPASLVRGPGGGAPRIVFLPGRCSNAYAYLLSFPEAARAHGGVIAIDGDKPCGAAGSGFRSFSWDAELQEARVVAALAAVGGATLPPGGVTLVGYSAGAGIGALMVQRWPERYPKVVLIGAPSDPSPARLARAHAVVTMSCSLDVPGRMKDAARKLSAAGVPARYLEMPGCTHGNLADGERLFGAAFDWLDGSPRAGGD